MAELKENLDPYQLEQALEVDRADPTCFVLDVGRDDKGDAVDSLEHVVSFVDNYLLYVHDLPSPTTKLYVIGDWKLESVTQEQPETKSKASDKKPRYKAQGQSQSEHEWRKATEQIVKLVQQMPALKELTWISGLPFMSMIWETLSTSLTKLVLDIGQPVRIEQDGDIEYKSYITQDEMKPLVQQTELKELRLFRMHDSMQTVVWETIFKNVSESGVRVADLQMAVEPIVRATNWHKAEDVVGLTVPKAGSKEKEYKGIEGKGLLHYSFGTGEYLDDFCMRKARIAGGLEEAKPLPLWCLKLDGFVVDYLPFEHELSRIALLTCGKNCVDSGLRAPKTPRTPHNRWSKIVNNATTHCLIQWPNWTGVFDDHGDQRDNHGDVVSQETGISTPAGEHPSPSPMPLTKESLQMKEMGDALADAEKDGGYFSSSPALSPSAGAEDSISMASNLSTRGSEAPTPAFEPVARSSPKMPAVDGSCSSGTTSPAGVSLFLVDSATTVESMTSTGSSFDQLSPLDIDTASAVVAQDPDDKTTAEKTASKTGGFKHKVRRSWDWLSGSGSGSSAAF